MQQCDGARVRRRLPQVDDSWVFLVGASTENDLKDLHVLDELEVAHWHPKARHTTTSRNCC